MKAPPTLAELSKPRGCVTGQFGKNCRGDHDEYQPVNHGFDEFFGNLYHLNAAAAEEAEVDCPKAPEFCKRFRPRKFFRSEADGTIEDTGTLIKKRMETVDEEFLADSLDFIGRQHKKRFFCWFSSTRIHFFSHLQKTSAGRTGRGDYADGTVEQDGQVGQLIKRLDDLEIADNTILIYTTDSGADRFSGRMAAQIHVEARKLPPGKAVCESTL